MQPSENPNSQNETSPPPPSTTQPRVDVSSIYPSAPTSSYASPEVNQPTVAKPKRTRLLIAGALVLVLAIGGGILVFAAKNKPAENNKPAASETKTSSGPTALENKLSKDQLATLNAVTYSFYIPPGQSVAQSVLIYNKPTPSHTMLSYGVNMPSGGGLAPGSYSYRIYPKTNDYNPPTSCSPLVQPVQCTAYKDANKDLPAYVYNGVVGPAITRVGSDGKGYTFITMMAAKDDMVIEISSVDTTASDLYSHIKSLQKVAPHDLPDSTQVYTRAE